MTTFLRVLEAEPERKGATLRAAAAAWRSGSEPEGIFEVEPSSFEQVPGSPFAYWVSERIRRLFKELPPFEGEGRTVKVGLQTSDDFRFVRAWWEVDAASLGEKWFPFAKGGAYSPFYSDVHLVVNWGAGGREVYGFDRAFVRNPDFFFRPGLTWPLRGITFSSQAVPAGSVFSVAGKMAFTDTGGLPAALALFNSAPFNAIIRLFAGKVGGVQYEVGLIGAVRYPKVKEPLPDLGFCGWSSARSLDFATQTSHAFTLPALLQVDGPTVAARSAAWAEHIADTEAELARIQSEIDDIAFDLCGIEGKDRRQMEEGFGVLGGMDEATEDADGADDARGADADDETAEAVDPVPLTESLLEWTLGVALGRFDVRLATGERTPPPEPDPFDPLPACSPAMLQDDDGLPTPEAPPGYPLELPPHGVLVDDPGHPWDVVARMEAVLDLVAGERAHAWVLEAEGILGRDLRDWLRRHGFERHLKRYSRSRRKAPLFWNLAPRSRKYGVWLYSPVASRDTMYRILNDYLDPKLRTEERRLLELRQEAGDSPTSRQRRDLSAQESLVEELRAFRDEVARVAPLWAPHRDDGVVLNCAVLWRLFAHHRAWQRECRKKWDELAAGKYDWAGWAMHLWPERVVNVCTRDRSIAIAHGLEEALWQEGDDGKWTVREDADERIGALVAERHSSATQAALDDFIRAV